MTALLEELLSERRTHKVQIIRRLDGTLQVLLFRWWKEGAPDHGKADAFWVEVRIPATITDDLEHARAIGLELLRAHARDAASQGEPGE
jgi:hypothetical protein